MHDVYIKSLRDDDIFLASFPKSGNTWMRFLLANIVSLIELDGMEIDYHMLNGPFVAELDSGKFGDLKYYCIPRFVKTHERYDADTFGLHKSVYVSRNPGDVMVSFYEYQKGLKNGRGIPEGMTISAFIHDHDLGIDSWCRHVHSWLNSCTTWITYEDLKIDPFHTVRSLMHALDTPYIPDSILHEAIKRSDFSSIRKMEESKGLDANAMSYLKPEFRFARKGTVGQWMDRLTNDDIQFVNDWLVKYDLSKFSLDPAQANLGVSESVVLDHISHLVSHAEWGKAHHVFEQTGDTFFRSNESMMARSLVGYNAGHSDVALQSITKISEGDFFYDKAIDLKRKIESSPSQNDQIRRQIFDGDIDGAIQLLSADELDSGEDIDLLYLRAVSFYKKGNVLDAVDVLQKILKSHPYHSPAKMLLILLEGRYELSEFIGSEKKAAQTKIPISPLTGSDRIIRLRSISRDRIIQRYKDHFGVDVSCFFEELESIQLYKCLDTGYRFYFPHHLSGDREFYNGVRTNPLYPVDWDWEVGVLGGLINPDQHVLDISCSNNPFNEYLKGRGIPNESLQLGNRAANNHKEQSNFFSKTIEDYAQMYAGSYDVVCGLHVLECISNPLFFLKASMDVLKPGGRLYLSVLNHNSIFGLDTNNILNMPPHHMGRWNEQAIMSLQQVLGLELVNLQFQPLQDNQSSYVSRVVGEQIDDYLNIQDPLIQILKTDRSKIKGVAMVAEFEKHGNEA